MEELATPGRPLRVAVIGAGPAGLYAVEALLKQAGLTLSIDVFNRFPTPFGLVRDGVAPDHQSIKAVIRVFERVLSDPRVRFFGNVTYGTDIHHHELQQFYDQVVYAVGAQADRRLGIPGEDLPNSFPATAFVGWYNGHPDYRNLPIDLSCERAIVVGNGNVAVDVTRLLVMSPDELAKTDIADHALEQLRASRVREVVMLGRRGPVQASYTTPELKELGKLAGVTALADPRDLELDPTSQAALENERRAQANLAYLHEYAKNDAQATPRRIFLRFLASPVEIVEENGRIAGVKIERNELVADAQGTLRARGTGQYETIEAGLVLRSVGYRSIPIEGVPFNNKTFTINNKQGRVMQPENDEAVPCEYVVGWAKRGPSGLIGNNKPDSVATVEAMVADLPQLPGIDDTYRDPARIEALLRERAIDYVTYQDWQLLDRYEKARGTERQCPRVKVTTVPEMMTLIRQGRTQA